MDNSKTQNTKIMHAKMRIVKLMTSFIAPTEMTKLAPCSKIHQCPPNTFQAVNYNEVLNYTDKGFICGQQNISWADFKTKKKSHGNEKCILKNGENVTLSRLWIDLKTDFSFEMSPKLTDL